MQKLKQESHLKELLKEHKEMRIKVKKKYLVIILIGISFISCHLENRENTVDRTFGNANSTIESESDILMDRLVSDTYVDYNDCYAFVKADYQNAVLVFDTIGGDAIFSFKNDLNEGNFVYLELLRYSEGYFYVNIWKEYMDSLNYDTINGWIKENNNIGCLPSSVLDSESSIRLYFSPDTIQNANYLDLRLSKNTFFSVVGCVGEMTNVKLYKYKDTLNGWCPTSLLKKNPF